MALLGHTARVIVSTQNIEASVDAWTSIGFEVEAESEALARLTDGQLLVSLIAEEFPSPAIAYFSADADRTIELCKSNGFAASIDSNGVLQVGESFGIDVYLHQRDASKQELPSGEQSPLLGYFDGIAVQVPDVAKTRQNMESLGFFVQEEWNGHIQQSDVTDGLIIVSLRNILKRTMLTYITDIGADLVETLEAVPGITVAAQKHNNNVYQASITMPEGTIITVAHEE